MLIKLKIIWLLTVILLLITGCKERHPIQVSQGFRPPDNPAVNGNTLADTGRPVWVQEYAECSGTFVLPASEIVNVTTPIAGVLKNVIYPAGSYVKEGFALAAIESIDLLKLQQDYLVTKSQFAYFAEELKRQGELTIENASSVKKMQQAQMEYQTCEIRLNSLAKQLALSGFNTDSISVDNITPRISINAPVSGYIDKIAVRAGNSISPGETLIVLVRNYKPMLVIEIPEIHIRKLKTGNSVSIILPGDSAVTSKATLTYINKQIDPGKHMIRATAIPDSPSSRLMPGMQVRVILNTN